VVDVLVLQCGAAVRLYDEHPGMVTRRYRPQCDALVRQVEIEEVHAHGQYFRIMKTPAMSRSAPAMRPADSSRTVRPMKPIRSMTSPAVIWPASVSAITAVVPILGVS